MTYTTEQNDLYKQIRKDFFADRNVSKAIDALVDAKLFDYAAACSIVSSWQNTMTDQEGKQVEPHEIIVQKR